MRRPPLIAAGVLVLSLAPAAGVLVLALAPAAAAHSLLIASAPSADAVLAGAPPAVALHFNNRIEKKLSQIRLVPAGGAAHVLPVRIDGAVAALEAPLPPLAPGPYRVEWRVLSTDGHIVSGTFGFRVSP